MSQYQGIFQRYEKKYLLSRTQYQNLSRKLESHMREDQYGKSTICNIYYDTPDHRLIPGIHGEADLQRKASAAQLRRSEERRHRVCRTEEEIQRRCI